MSKRRGLVALIILFNAIIVTGFILSNIYMWNFLKTEINEKASYNGQGLYAISCIEGIGFQVSISHPVYANGTIVNLGPLPTVIPNYPFILFWVSIIGNLVFIALVLRNKASKQSS
jgi:hypothetical protein